MVDEEKGTETPRFINGRPNRKAYNCHSFTWHNSRGDRTDFRNMDLLRIGITKWDASPDDDMGKYKMLHSDEPNNPNDRVIWYLDKNGSGQYEKGEFIGHSAIVKAVDSEGYTTHVRSKLGGGGLSTNHPLAPGYYHHQKDSKGNIIAKYSRAYFRKK